MATYKVIQDIEAEDKFVGPLSLKQFVFAMSGAFFGWLSVFLAQQGAPFLMAFTVPPSLVAFFLAIPWSREQPTEIWVLAKMRFMVKPKKRIWDQSGMQELVTITAPKKRERALTKNLSQEEVKSRLSALAETIDSRGWVVKHATAEEAMGGLYPADDRLISASTLPQEVPAVDIDNIPDMMDEEGNAVSANFDQMIKAKDDERKAQAVEKMERIRRGEPIEEEAQSQQAIIPPAATVPVVKAVEISQMDEKLLSNELQAKKSASKLGQGRMHSIPSSKPPVETPSQAQPANHKAQAVTSGARPDIINLAQNNDLNVATIARQANKSKDDEVVVSLH